MNVLKLAQSTHPIQRRPVLLVAQNVTSELAGMCLDYSVKKVVAGKYSASILTDRMVELRDQELSDSEIKTGLKKIKAASEPHSSE